MTPVTFGLLYYADGPCPACWSEVFCTHFALTGFAEATSNATLSRMEKKEKSVPALPPSEPAPRNWNLITLLAVLSLFCGFVYALQAPFYPIEAQRKGVSVAVIGFVYGVYELTSFVVSPFAGAALTRIGPVSGLHWGILLTGLSTVGLGLLSFVGHRVQFVMLSTVFRILQSVGASLRHVAILSMATFAFPKTVATTLASVESIGAVGSCLGGIAGGGLMEVSGFMTTFTLSGAILALAVAPSVVMLRKFAAKEAKPLPTTSAPGLKTGASASGGPPKIGLRTLLTTPGIALAVYSLVSPAASYGAAVGVMEPYLQQFGPTPFQVGLVFMCPQMFYMLSCPTFGYLYDRLKLRWASRPPAALYRILHVIPACFLTGFLLVGPVPFAPFEPSLPLTTVGLTFLGIGAGSSSASTFLIAVEEGKRLVANRNVGGVGGVSKEERHGDGEHESEEMHVHELISGIWRGAISLGLFAGPVLSGVLYDVIGFRNASVIIVGMQLIHMALISACVCAQKKSEKF